MLKSLKALKLTALCVVLTSNVLPYINHIVTWEKDRQKIFGCGDIHDARQVSANFGQMAFLHQNMSLLDKRDTCVLVEDVKAYEGSDPEVAQHVEHWPAVMPQNGLVSVAARAGILARNIEFRHARSAALCPFIQDNFDSQISARSVIEEFDMAVSTFAPYKDEHQLAGFYTEHINLVCNKNSAILDSIRKFSGSLTAWIRSEVPVEKRVAFASRMRFWDARFLDLVAINHIVQHMAMPKILIFAGAMHVFHIGRVLENILGYTRTQVVGLHREMPYAPIALDIESINVNRVSGSGRSPLFDQFTPLETDRLKSLFV